MLADTITKADGLQVEETRTETCERPSRNGDKIWVHYRGTLENGVQFDESYDRGQPFAFELGAHQVIAGWDEGLLDMCVGSRRKLIIPPELGYGPRNMGIIPPNSVLIFHTEMMRIKGLPGSPPPPLPPPPSAENSVQEDKPAETPIDKPSDAKPDDDSTTSQEAASTGEEDKQAEDGVGKSDNSSEQQTTEDKPATIMDKDTGECRLLGPFALVVQSALGVLALLSLVFKRWRERPRRPLKIWFFDVSKQVVGTALLHVANLAMSMLSTNGLDAAAHASSIAAAHKGENDKMPNPCSFYLLNLAIDTTIGIPILVVLLRLLHAIFLRTPLANPPESLKSGHYGTPPHVTWWIKQSFIYFIGLFGMKLFVLFMFQALPWLPWVGDWALRWTEGNESVQIAFVMFIFPLAMNGIQYYIIDTFIKESAEEGYESVQQDDNRSEDDDQGEESVIEVSQPDSVGAEDKAAPVISTIAERDAGEGSESSSVPKTKRGQTDI